MDAKDWEAPLVLDVFGDSLCRSILVVAAGSPISAAALADRLDVTPPTVYKRLDQLLKHDLLREHRRVDEEGTHYRVFETSLRRARIDVDTDGYDIELEFRTPDDRFAGFWTEFMGSHQLESNRAEEFRPLDGSKNGSSSL